jgi:hypothetical protein
VTGARFELYVPARPLAGRARRQPDAPVSWRLLSGNNRDLGRAAATFPDVDECRAAVGRLRAALADPQTSIGSPDGRTRWNWQIWVGPVQAAVSSRVYQRRVQAEAACAVFLSLAAGAPITETVRLVGSGRAVRL